MAAAVKKKKKKAAPRDNGKHPGGRPTDYTPELLQMAQNYISGEWKKQGHVIPSIVGLCVYLNCAKATLYRWCQEGDRPEIRDILFACNDIQHLTLLKGGLNGTMNPTIVKLVLGKHGYHERPEGDSGELKNISIYNTLHIDVGMLSEDKIDQRIAQLLSKAGVTYEHETLLIDGPGQTIPGKKDAG